MRRRARDTTREGSSKKGQGRSPALSTKTEPAYLPACSLMTLYAPLTSWQTSQLSPNLGSVWAAMWAMLDLVVWQAAQAAVVAGAGSISAPGSFTALRPMGNTASVPVTWHISQLVVSPGRPVKLKAG